MWRQKIIIITLDAPSFLLSPYLHPNQGLAGSSLLRSHLPPDIPPEKPYTGKQNLTLPFALCDEKCSELELI